MTADMELSAGVIPAVTSAVQVKEANVAGATIKIMSCFDAKPTTVLVGYR